jgi:hypothetical protein
VWREVHLAGACGMPGSAPHRWALYATDTASRYGMVVLVSAQGMEPDSRFMCRNTKWMRGASRFHCHAGIVPATAPPPSDSGETLSPSLPRTTSCLFGFPWVFHVRLRIDMLAADVRAYPPPDYIAALHSDAAACSRTREAIVVQVKVPHARRHVRRQLSAQLVALQHQHCMRMPPQPRSAHRYVCLRGLEYVK